MGKVNDETEMGVGWSGRLGGAHRVRKCGSGGGISKFRVAASEASSVAAVRRLLTATHLELKCGGGSGFEQKVRDVRAGGENGNGPSAPRLKQLFDKSKGQMDKNFIMIQLEEANLKDFRSSIICSGNSCSRGLPQMSAARRTFIPVAKFLFLPFA